MGWRQSLGFAAFCLLAASRWLVESAFPTVMPPLLAQSMHDGLIAIVAVGVLLVRRRKEKFPLVRVALASLLLLCIPALINLRVQGETTLFALVPVCIVVGISAFAGAEDQRAAMFPALVGLTGALLILPFKLPSTIKSGLLFGTVLGGVASAAVGSVWVHRLLQKQSIVSTLAVVSIVNAICLGIAGILYGSQVIGLEGAGVEAMRGLLFDLPQMVLLLWLLREMNPTRFGARFFAVPLLTVCEGVIVLRGPIGLRLVLGIVLLLVGMGTLLLSRPGGEAPTSLRL